MSPDLVPNEPFRREFMRNEELTPHDVCKAAGWMRKKKNRQGVHYEQSDNTTMKRKLGIVPDTRLADNATATTLTYEEAASLVSVFGFDPVDVGV